MGGTGNQGTGRGTLGHLHKIADELEESLKGAKRLDCADLSALLTARENGAEAAALQTLARPRQPAGFRQPSFLNRSNSVKTTEIAPLTCGGAD